METFNKIYKDNYSTVLNWCKFRTKNVEDAEELTTTIFMKIHNNLTEYDSERSSINTWIMNITKNTLIDFWRTNKQDRFDSISDMVDDEGHELFIHTDWSNPESTYENVELGQAIEEAINSLPSTYKTIADKFLLQEKSHEEIALDLNIPLGTVKGVIHRAKKMLQAKLSNL